MADQTIPLKMDPSGILAELVDDDTVRVAGSQVFVGEMEMEITAFAKMIWMLLLLYDARLSRLEEQHGISNTDLNVEAHEIAQQCFDPKDGEDLGFAKAKGIFDAIRNLRANRKKNRAASPGEE